MQTKSSQPQSISSSQEPRASRFPSWANARAWMTSVANWQWDSGESFAQLTHDGSSGKTSPEFSPATKGETSAPSSGRWGNSGFTVPGGFWTLATSECPRGGVGSTLSDVLETGAPPLRCCLTPRHAQRLLERLRKYRKNPPVEVSLLLEAHGLGCPEMRPPRASLESPLPCGQAREERETSPSPELHSDGSRP